MIKQEIVGLKNTISFRVIGNSYHTRTLREERRDSEEADIASLHYITL